MQDTTQCRGCQREVSYGGQGRPPRFCSAACRQRAYRARQRVQDAPTPAPRRRRRLAQDRPTVPVEKDVPHLSRRQLLAWRGVLEVQSALLPALEAELRDKTGLTLSEFDVLYQLWRMPGQKRRMNDLARAVVVTPGGVTRLVGRLEERGLVCRQSEGGRQAVETVLTARGEQELQAAMDVHFDGVRRRFVQYLDDVDIDRVISLWARVTGTDETSAAAGS